jgi:hypothetical protein
LYESEADPLNVYRHHKRVQGNWVATNDEIDRNVDCDWNFFTVQKAANNKGIAMAFIKNRLQLPVKPAMEHLAVLKADVLVKK